MAFSNPYILFLKFFKKKYSLLKQCLLSRDSNAEFLAEIFVVPRNLPVLLDKHYILLCIVSL